MSMNNRKTTTLPRLLTDGCWIVTPIMQRYYNNSDGCTTNRATVTAVRNKPLSTWRNLSKQITATPRAGTSLDAATCPKRNTPRHMRLISKRSTVTDGIQHSGAPSAYFIIKSISTVMRSMPIPEPSA
ncbi:hypothetical protein EMCG_08302 [[Emmonsia] crescens]|uniref:Uncharacterized protein n=1 Tax=[Emmonsia] crescens TaxID=73230 RepID=A0A0G2J4K7_9EURO|nr:hypothetical protein EMCG_08302 [Emmonsia crescens UAMH 3008]